MIMLFIFIGLIAYLFYMSRKFANPYKLTMIFGKKGSGKTTLLTKLAIKHRRKGWNVYTTSPVPGCYYFNPSELGLSDFPPESAIFVDEVGLVWNNRDWKSFRGDTRAYFKYQRHLHHKIYLFSQAFDVDKNLRDLTDHMYLTRCLFNIFSIAVEVQKSITVVTAADSNGESKIADDLKIVPLWMFWAGSRIFTYIPAWVKYFDSFDPLVYGRAAQAELVPALPDIDKSEQLKNLVAGSFAKARARVSRPALLEKIRSKKDDPAA